MAIPFTVTDAVYLCWGLTLRFSHETQQQDIGKEYFTKLNENLNSIPDIDRPFVTEFFMILLRTTRNMGLIRLAHVRHLEKEARDYGELDELLNSISDLSFSKESIPLKLLSFFGFGSTIFAINPFKETLSNFESVEAVLNNTRGILSVNQINEYIHRILDFNQSIFSLESIITFILLGSIGIFVGSIIFKVFTYFYLKDKEKKLTKSQQEYWEEEYLDDMTRILFFFYKDIKDLLRRHYDYTVIGANVNDRMMNLTDDEVKSYIKEKVLPDVTIQWDMWLPEYGSSAKKPEKESESED